MRVNKDMGGCKVKESDDGLACTGFEDKLRKRRVKRISSDSDALLMILSEIESLRFDLNSQYRVNHIHASRCPKFLR